MKLWRKRVNSEKEESKKLNNENNQEKKEIFNETIKGYYIALNDILSLIYEEEKGIYKDESLNLARINTIESIKNSILTKKIQILEEMQEFKEINEGIK